MKKTLLSSFMLFAAATLFVSCDPVTPEPTPPAPPEPADPVITSIVQYYGGDVTSNYSLIMVDCEVDADGEFRSEGSAYILDLYSTLPTDPENWRPSVGKYEFAQSGTAANSIIVNNSMKMPIINEEGEFVTDNATTQSITGGSVVITHEGANGFIAVVDITMLDGTTAKFTANNFDRVDKSTGGGGENDQTSLMEDIEINLAATTGYLNSYGNGNWVLSLDDFVTNLFDIDLYCESMSTTEVPVGTYTASEGGEVNTFAPGVFEYLTYVPTAYFDYLTEDFAAIVGGTITISKAATGGKYTVVIDVVDVLDNKITGSWTGDIELPAPDEEYAPAAKAAKKAISLKSRYGKRQFSNFTQVHSVI